MNLAFTQNLFSLQRFQISSLDLLYQEHLIIQCNEGSTTSRNGKPAKNPTDSFSVPLFLTLSESFWVRFVLGFVSIVMLNINCAH